MKPRHENISCVRGCGCRGGAIALAGWVFAPLGGGEEVGFNDGGIDLFKSTKVRSVAREVVQNSLDAAADLDRPVRVVVEPVKILEADAEDLFAISETMEACLGESKRAEEQKFFQRSLDLLESGEMPALLFHDQNTTGLIGPLEGSGPWRALTRSAGVTNKSNGGLGSFGHGARAPFALSGLRTVLYLTQIETDSGYERRAVGRSVLMSHTKDGARMQAVGFFGKGSEATPLVNGDIPEWLDKLRPASLGHGTTLVVLDVRGSDFKERFEYEIIRSYALALEANHLEVDVLGEQIDSHNLRDTWIRVLNSIGNDSAAFELDQIDRDIVSTILDPDKELKLETSLGECLLRFTSNNPPKRRVVSVARGGGMLITSKPEFLKVFQGLQYFSCVVWVRDKNGSSTLSKLENPNHNDFSKDWLPEEATDQDKNEVWDKYRDFTSSVREVLKQLFEIETSDTFESDLLQDLFDGLDRPEEASSGSARVVKVIQRKRQNNQKGEAGRGSSGPAVPAKGPGKTKKPGPRRIIDISGKQVSLDGWKPVGSLSAKCRIRPLGGSKYDLEASFDSAPSSDVGIVFCAVGANNDAVSVSGLQELEAGKTQLGVTIELTDLASSNYSIDALVFIRDEKSPRANQEGGDPHGNS